MENIFIRKKGLKISPLYFMRIWFYQYSFIIGIYDETSLTLIRFFNEFSLAIIHGDFVAFPSIGEIRAKFRGK